MNNKENLARGRKKGKLLARVPQGGICSQLIQEVISKIVSRNKMTRLGFKHIKFEMSECFQNFCQKQVEITSNRQLDKEVQIQKRISPRLMK